MSVKVFACGDIVNNVHPTDFVENKLSTVIDACDLAICNFEGPVRTPDMVPIRKAGPHLCQSQSTVSSLTKAGFTLASLANNHIFDYGDAGFESTIAALESNHIAHLGAGRTFEAAYRPFMWRKKGVSIGVVSGCENGFGCVDDMQTSQGGYAWINHHRIDDMVRELKGEVDFVIVIAHAGVENVDFPIIEWRQRYQRLADIGADVIIGHHPHVAQGYERRGRSVIFFSLGNFYFNSTTTQHELSSGYSVIVTLEPGADIEFEIVYSKIDDARITLTNAVEVGFSLQTLNEQLGKDYRDLNDEIAVRLYKQFHRGYYESALFAPPLHDPPVEMLRYVMRLLYRLARSSAMSNNREIARYVLNLLYRLVRSSAPGNNSETNRQLLLLHNLSIESHRYVVQRALRVLIEETANSQ